MPIRRTIEKWILLVEGMDEDPLDAGCSTRYPIENPVPSSTIFHIGSEKSEASLPEAVGLHEPSSPTPPPGSMVRAGDAVRPPPPEAENSSTLDAVQESLEFQLDSSRTSSSADQWSFMEDLRTDSDQSLSTIKPSECSTSNIASCGSFRSLQSWGSLSITTYFQDEEDHSDYGDCQYENDAMENVCSNPSIAEAYYVDLDLGTGCRSSHSSIELEEYPLSDLASCGSFRSLQS
ncbi:hypothetical protein K402DRAFT_467846 [Aulographum hederae CBS 113979]|uniref:Uncharacterized protein n=1 Tax=Aulographum hederae CBS 113979 TaxID=1176131 RepID=A0A6G1GJC0_9PEZI|nr:hypothetical protein K402DRAFT_467846 [Aulographum hederae CBS 113979]